MRDENRIYHILSSAAAFLLLLLFMAVPALAQLEDNTNRPGMDISSFEMDQPDPNICSAACSNDPNCRSFTYVKPGCQGEKALCWLKNGVPEAVPDDCAVSGVKAGAQATQFGQEMMLGSLLPIAPGLSSSSSSPSSSAGGQSTDIMGPGGSSSEGTSGAYLFISGVPGDSAEDKHRNWIDVLAFNYSISNPGAGSHAIAGAAASERPALGDLVIVKPMDKSSPKVYLLTSNGDHIPEAKLEILQNGVMVLQYRLNDVTVTSVEAFGKEEVEGWMPLERVSLSYGKIEWSYTKTNEATSVKETVKAGWDLVANKAI